jgi:hypothetical protein
MNMKEPADWYRIPELQISHGAQYAHSFQPVFASDRHLPMGELYADEQISLLAVIRLSK